jgi:hypothetical protein
MVPARFLARDLADMTRAICVASVSMSAVQKIAKHRVVTERSVTHVNDLIERNVTRVLDVLLLLPVSWGLCGLERIDF